MIESASRQVVAAYCRVSTDQADQANSFESQKRYFKAYIEQHPGWQLFHVYADQGISGTNTQKRIAFLQMISDAQQHKFDLILTKEISRFARNTLDSIYYTRALKQLGIGVWFLNDNLNTLEEESELFLAIKSTIAQEESRATSARVKWGQMRRMEQGVVFGHSLLGYDVKDGQLVINPRGAELVQSIFRKYVLEGKGAATIARELQAEGVPTLAGNGLWYPATILKILSNEKYCGDLIQKKTYTPNFLTHQKKYNHGEEKKVVQRNHHTPIVDRALWEAAQQERVRRTRNRPAGAGHGNRYPLSGKIECGICGKHFVSRKRTSKDGEHHRIWRCATATMQGGAHIDHQGTLSGCNTGYQISDRLGIEMVRKAVSGLEMDRERIAEEWTEEILAALSRRQEAQQQNIKAIRQERSRLLEKKRAALDAFLSGCITQTELNLVREDYDRQLEKLTVQISRSDREKGTDLAGAQRKEEIYAAILRIITGVSASDRIYGQVLEKITAWPNRSIVVQLKHLPTRWCFRLSHHHEKKNQEEP